jgi:hypothetical protein
MRRPTFFQFLIFLALSLSFFSAAQGSEPGEHDRMMRERPVPAKEPELRTVDDLKKEIRALRERVATLEALKPTFTNFMPNFSERFHVMHRAGDVGDWAVAAHEIDEMQRLTRASKYIDPKQGALMQGFMDGNLRKLKEAIQHGNAKSFQAALKTTVASCNGCHTATGSAIVVSLNVDDSLSMRHAHALKKSTVPKEHTHAH